MTHGTDRYRSYLRQRYRVILAYTGMIWLIVGALMLAPLLLLFFDMREVALAWGMILPGTILVALGFTLWRLLRPSHPPSLSYQEGTVIVVLAWLMAILWGALPFCLLLGLPWTEAVFESTSGWTTTGLSVIDVTQTPRLLLLYRSITQLAGGAGLAIITLSALAGPAGVGLSNAEGRSEQLVPHIQRSVKLVLTMYAGYVIVGIVLLFVSGMEWFDAVNHAFTALSTGGFSTRAASIGYWDSPQVEAAVILLMLLGTLNFMTGYLLLRRKGWAVLRNGELHMEALLIPVAALFLFVGVTWSLYPSLSKGLRVAIFEVVAALSTTGFSTVPYVGWNGFGLLLLIVLMIIGGGAGSTAGAMKQYRVYVLYRALIWEIRRNFLPQGAVSAPEMWQGEAKHFITREQLRQVSLFVFLYLVTLLIGSLIIAFHGFAFDVSLFEFTSSLGTVGLSLGVTAPDTPIAVLWAQIVGMILGRLEFFAVIYGVMKLARDGWFMVQR